MTVDEVLAKASATSPELAMRLKTVARDELSVNLAKKELHPDYTISAGYFNQGSMAPMYQVRVDIPLRLHAEKNQRPAITEQVNLLAGARREFEASGQQLQFKVREAYLAAETAWRLKKLYEDTVLPQSQLTVESSLTAYQTGASDFVAVLNNLATQTDVQEQLHEQEMNYQVALARLEEMTGVEIQ
jgi:outer membrane protein TolC